MHRSKGILKPTSVVPPSTSSEGVSKSTSPQPPASRVPSRSPVPAVALNQVHNVPHVTRSSNTPSNSYRQSAESHRSVTTSATSRSHTPMSTDRSRQHLQQWLQERNMGSLFHPLVRKLNVNSLYELKNVSIMSLEKAIPLPRQCSELIVALRVERVLAQHNTAAKRSASAHDTLGRHPAPTSGNDDNNLDSYVFGVADPVSSNGASATTLERQPSKLREKSFNAAKEWRLRGGLYLSPKRKRLLEAPFPTRNRFTSSPSTHDVMMRRKSEVLLENERSRSQSPMLSGIRLSLSGAPVLSLTSQGSFSRSKTDHSGTSIASRLDPNMNTPSHQNQNSSFNSTGGNSYQFIGLNDVAGGACGDLGDTLKSTGSRRGSVVTVAPFKIQVPQKVSELRKQLAQDAAARSATHSVPMAGEAGKSNEDLWKQFADKLAKQYVRVEDFVQSYNEEEVKEALESLGFTVFERKRLKAKIAEEKVKAAKLSRGPSVSFQVSAVDKK